jgi:hypothetical protein
MRRYRQLQKMCMGGNCLMSPHYLWRETACMFEGAVYALTSQRSGGVLLSLVGGYP